MALYGSVTVSGSYNVIIKSRFLIMLKSLGSKIYNKYKRRGNKNPN